MRRFKTLYALASILVLLPIVTACSPQKRASRLINKARVLSPEMFQDTTIKTQVQVITPERESVGEFPLEFDRPLVTQRDGVYTSVTVTHDTVYVYTRVEPDTVVKEVENRVEVIKPQQPKENEGFFGELRKVIWALFAVLVLIMIIKYLPNDK